MNRAIMLAVMAMLTAGLLAVGCDGGASGEELTLEEYFERLEQLSNDADERSQELEEEFDEASLAVQSEEEGIEAVRTFFAGSLPVFEDFVHSLADLEPPEEVQDLHDEGVEAGNGAVQVLRDAFDRLNDVTSEQELDALFTDLDADAAFQRFDDACRELQSVAGENEIDVDLDCGDEE